MEHLAGKVILLSGWRRALLAFAAGGFCALGQPPYDFPAACFITFPILVWLLDGAATVPGHSILRRLALPFLIGWLFGFGYFLAGLWWIGNALLVEADLFAWALPLASLGLPALIAIFYGAATAFARLIWSDGAGRIAMLAAAFGLSEWLRTFILTGFPWNAIGQAVMPVPSLMQSVGIVGMIGINTLAVFVFAAPALLASTRGLRAGCGLAALIAALHIGYGYMRIAGADAPADKSIQVRLVQPSVNQGEKWDEEMRDHIFETYLDLSRTTEDSGPSLIVWPETAVPFILSQQPEALVALGELIGDRQDLLAGAVRIEGSGTDARFYNSVVAINSGGEIFDAVDKIRLVPFGEYLPLADLLSNFGMRRLVESVSDFSPGGQRHPIILSDDIKVLPFICYEIIFPGIAGYSDADSDLILNITNDAWFGDTPGPYQHFRQAQIRVVEAGRPLIRSANNGISGAVDAYGRVIDAYGIDAVGALDVTVPLQRLQPMVKHPDLLGAAIVAVFGVWGAASSLASRRRFD